MLASLLRMMDSSSWPRGDDLPLSLIVRVTSGVLLFVSGQIAEPPLLAADLSAQARSVCQRLASIVASEGRSLRDVVRVGIFLVDMADFTMVNEVYREFFAAPYPARTTVAVKALPLGARIEMDAVVR